LYFFFVAISEFLIAESQDEVIKSSIQLEKQAQDYILENIRNTVNNKKNLIGKLHDFMDIKGAYIHTEQGETPESQASVRTLNIIDWINFIKLEDIRELC